MYGKGLLFGLEFMPPEMRRHIYGLARLKITIDPDFSFKLQGDINANVIRYSKEAEDYAQKQAEWERRWTDSPPDFWAAKEKKNKELQAKWREDQKGVIIPLGKTDREGVQWRITC